METSMARPLSLVVLAVCCTACSDTAVDPAPEHPVRPTALYMGETPPTDEAVVFAPGVVSKTGRYEYAMSIHPDGDRLLFSAETPDQGAAVYQSRINNGVWSVPAPVAPRHPGTGG